MDKIKINIPVIVEGRYDKARLASALDATVIATDGFGVFKNEEKRALIRALGKNGVIVLCDSDGGGKIIRSHLSGMLGGMRVYNLYTPQIEGKEKRKSAPSAEGYLGVEGIPTEILRGIFEKFIASHPELTGEGEGAEKNTLSRSDMLELGLTGGAGASELRDKLCMRLGLPKNMNANALFEAINILSSADDVREIIKEIR